MFKPSKPQNQGVAFYSIYFTLGSKKGYDALIRWLSFCPTMHLQKEESIGVDEDNMLRQEHSLLSQC